MDNVQNCDNFKGHTQKNGAAAKVIKNLFLTLRGHNIYRQQRELSEFLMSKLRSFIVRTLSHTTHIHTVIKLIPDSV
jgi:hypothetical protein